MTPDSDSGIDKQNVLASITGASEAPPPAPPRPADRPPSAVRPSPLPPSGAARWVRHRSEIAAIVTAFVGVLWLAVGIGRGSWAPSVIGIFFGLGALAIWTLEVWNAD